MIQSFDNTGYQSALVGAIKEGRKDVVRLLEGAVGLGRYDEMAKRRREKKENKGNWKVSEFNSSEISGHRSQDLDSILQVFSQGVVLICNVDAV